MSLTNLNSENLPDHEDIVEARYARLMEKDLLESRKKPTLKQMRKQKIAEDLNAQDSVYPDGEFDHILAHRNIRM